MQKTRFISPKEIIRITRSQRGELNPRAVAEYEMPLGEACKKGYLATDRGTMTWSAELANPKAGDSGSVFLNKDGRAVTWVED